MKKLFWIISALFYILLAQSTHAISIQWELEKVTDSKISNISEDNWLSMLASLAAWFKTEIMTLVWVFSIGVFIFIWMKVVMARWNPEEFKKAMLYFVYAVIWIFFIFMAWWLVRLVTTLKL